MNGEITVKKTLKTLISIVIIMMLTVSVFAFSVSAASVTVTGGQYNVGASVNVTVRFSADAALYAVEADISYNSSVLRLNSVSGADYNVGNGTVKIVDDGFTASKPTTTSSYTLNFTAIAAGNSNITASVLGGGAATSRASGSATITVVTPKPSSNANLASIKLSAGALSPAFSPNTTNYSSTVSYGVDSITITGSVADGGATYAGGGTFALNLGDNSRTLTVTAADGTKKSYTINIKRMTEQETADAEAAAREANPNLVVINNTDYNIVSDTALIAVPSGFVAATEIRKEAELPVIKDASGKYTLWYLTDANGENGDFYTRDENDNFTRLNYINANGKMYIIEEDGEEIELPAGFVLDTLDLKGEKVPAYKWEDDELGDFYVLYMYVDGESGYYRYDMSEGTVQRALDFYLAATASQEEPKEEITLLQKFKNLNTTGKVIIITVVFAILAAVALIVLLIVKLCKKPVLDDEYATSSEDNMFITTMGTDEVPFKTEETISGDEQ